MAIKSVSFRMDETMLDKLHVVANYEGRSVNSQVVIWVRNHIKAFEAKHGEIFEKQAKA